MESSQMRFAVLDDHNQVRFVDADTLDKIQMERRADKVRYKVKEKIFMGNYQFADIIGNRYIESNHLDEDGYISTAFLGGTPLRTDTPVEFQSFFRTEVKIPSEKGAGAFPAIFSMKWFSYKQAVAHHAALVRESEKYLRKRQTEATAYAVFMDYLWRSEMLCIRYVGRQHRIHRLKWEAGRQLKNLVTQTRQSLNNPDDKQI